MSRDYKPRPEKTANAKKGSPLLTGLLIGFLLGVAASLSVVMFIKGGESPFTQQGSQEKSVADKIKENANAVADKTTPAATADSASVEGSSADDKTRFDFYTILPNSESKVSAEEERKIKENALEPVVQQSYYLQAGAFQSEEEADNMKAKLALQGFEALVQTATIPDKGVWHRVRVGPLKDLEKINKTKSDLLSNGFKADLIRINNENQ
jgi:cell division protein FtsN